MNRLVVRRTAAGLAAHLWDGVGRDAAPPLAVVGYDARRGSAAFAADTAAVLTAAGVQTVLLPDPLPTPVLAFAVRHLSADAGVMVTASHNPPADNGYKVYLGGRLTDEAGRGAQIVSPADAQIAARIDHAAWAADIPLAEDGWTVAGPDLLEAYRAAALGVLDDDRHGHRDGVATVRHDGVVVAVLARDTDLAVTRAPSTLEHTYLDIAAERRQQLTAVVTTAVDLTEEQRTRLAGALQQIYSKPVQLQIVHDEDVIGGIRVQIGDEVVDGTVLRRLDEAKRHLAG